MKSLISISLLLILIAGCGKDGGGGSGGSGQNALTNAGQCSNSPILGRWESINRGTILEFTANCDYINTYCQSQGTFPHAQVLYSQGTVRITVDLKALTAPSGCLPVGTFPCTYQITTNRNPQLLQVTCAGVYGTYEKI